MGVQNRSRRKSSRGRGGCATAFLVACLWVTLAIQKAFAGDITSAELVIDASTSTRTRTITLSLVLSSQTEAGAVEELLPRMQLREGFFPPQVLGPLGWQYDAPGSSSNTVHIHLKPSVHHTTANRVAYTLLLASNTTADSSTPPSPIPISVQRLGASLAPDLLTANSRVCFSSTLFPSEPLVSIISTWDHLQALAEARCTSWRGSIHVHSIDREPKDWAAAFASLEELEGFLAVSNCSGFSTHHLAHLQRVATGITSQLSTFDSTMDDTNTSGSSEATSTSAPSSTTLPPSQEEGEESQPASGFAISFTDNRNFSVDANLLYDLYAAMQRGGLRIVRNSPPVCLSPSSTAGFWWRNTELVHIEYDPSSCSTGCPLFSFPTNAANGTNSSNDTSLVCSSRCPEEHKGTCSRVCADSILSSQQDLDNVRACTRIAGNLGIVNLPLVSDSSFDALRSIRHVDGALMILDNDWLVSLEHLRQLQYASSVFIRGNKRLVDARLPNLATASTLDPETPSGSQSASTVFVNDNDRLCPEGEPNGTMPCANVTVVATFLVPSLSTSLFSAPAFESVLSELLRVSPETVSAFLSLNHAAASAAGTAAGGSTSSSSLSTTTTTTQTVTARVQCTLGSSLAILTNLTGIAESQQLAHRLSTVINGFAYEGIALRERPHRMPQPGSGVDYGITLSSSLKTDELQLSWSRPADADAASVVYYRVEYAPRASTEQVNAFASYLGSSRLVAGEQSLLARKAEDALGRMFDHQSVSVRDAQAASISTCQQLRGSSVLTRDSRCLQPELRYQAHVVGQIGFRRTLSNGILAQADDLQLYVRNATASGPMDLSSAAPSARVSWQRPQQSRRRTASVLGYQLQIRRADDFNGILQDAGEVDAASFTRELLAAHTKQRIYLPTSRSTQDMSFDLSGCFHDYALNVTHCVQPWTTYQVTVRVLSAFLGPGSTLHVTTPRKRPTTAPQLHGAEHEGSASSVSLRVARPEPLTTVITAFRVSYTSQRGESGVYVYNISSPLSSQRSVPQQVFHVRVPDLSVWTAYEMEVTAVSEEGESPVLLASTRTDEGVPDKLGPVTFGERLSTGEWQVLWEPPMPTPGRILRYDLIQEEDLLANRTTAFVFRGNTTSAALALDSRLIRIRAVTSKGEGEWSDLPRLSSGSSETWLDVLLSPAVASGVAGGLVLIIVVVVVVVVRRRARNLEKRAACERFVAPAPDEWEYDPQRLSLGRELGKGAFGIVHEGVANGIREMTGLVTVAVKQCAPTDGCELTITDRNEFLDEAKLMKRFSDPFHPNVVRLLGVVTQVEPLMIITEYMGNGDLRSFLRQHRPRNGKPGTVPLSDLVFMAADVASGMAFLASRKFVHRDLACRNCLVASDLTTKVADFGLSRSLNYAEYYRKNGQALLPIRWMDPNTLCNGRYTVESDVWAMGVVLWEMMAYGALPYRGHTNEEVFEAVIAGRRLEQPPGCPDGVFDLMWDCWQLGNRPTFAEIEKRLANLGGLVEQGAETPLLSCSVGGELGVFADDVHYRKHINEATGMAAGATETASSSGGSCLQASGADPRYAPWPRQASTRRASTDTTASSGNEYVQQNAVHAAAQTQHQMNEQEQEGYCDMSGANRPGQHVPLSARQSTDVVGNTSASPQSLAAQLASSRLVLQRNRTNKDNGDDDDDDDDDDVDEDSSGNNKAANDTYVSDSYCDMKNANVPQPAHPSLKQQRLSGGVKRPPSATSNAYSTISYTAMAPRTDAV